MTQSEDSLWTANFGLWNNPVADSGLGDIWNGSTQTPAGSVVPNFQKINGLSMFLNSYNDEQIASLIGKDPEKPADGVKLPDAVDILTSWNPMNSIFQDVEKNSIWSPSDLYTTEDKNPSLSTSSLPWSSAPQDANRDIAESSTANEAWELPQNAIFFGIPELDQPEPWKFEQSLGNADAVQALPTAGNFAPFNSNCAAPTVITEAPVDCGPNVTGRSDSTTSESNSVKNNTSSEDSAKTAFSTEQLCDHLINSNEGWGKRPVDQSTPWDVSDIARPGLDQVGRSGITTPTPGSCSTSAVVGNFRGSSQIQRHESNVWTSEPPTGTGIWEMHYENNGARSSMWPVVTSSSNVPATQSTQPSSLMLMNNMRTAPQNGSLFQRPATYRNWDANDSKSFVCRDIQSN
ncbi:hypothetical protein FBUS_10374 [Fasciolopsis buskii]|uniref:Uncharacterized protein n=1 Tax=Fasciolopsis buskii TaxID=27845 RepID=A0A8E0VIJ4_9TREM|nr:hypothetical protein FBUS_10374 [Fasciolopsis buski]